MTSPIKRRLVAAATALATATAAFAVTLTAATVTASPAVAANGVPRPDHVVLVIFENKKANSIFGNAQAPYINSLANNGAKFTQSFAIEHPSEPNYLDLFSGSNQGVTDDSCPHTFGTANQASLLISAGLTFGGYSEGLPSVGSTTCSSGRYARKHNPWVDYTNVPASSNLTFESFPAYYEALPSVAYVIPDLCNGMHDCSVARGDAWLESRLDGYVQWARLHNSLFVLTFDEDGGNTATNQIPTIFVGPMVRPGDDATPINHYSVLRTLEGMYGVPATGDTVSAAPITSVWQSIPPTPIPIPRAPIIRVRPRDRQGRS